MYLCRKVLVILLLISAPLFAFDLDYKLNQLTDKLSNKLFDKAVDGVEKTVTGEPKKTVKPAGGKSKMDQLKELVEMKKQGYITDREFREQKKLILSQR